ncbi:phage Gp37/Gp68 family protein [Cypionkella sp.]|uniref:phage Gp37/Gp68 family protein n=1 Tax=Cypionkella sp. TaxID=2811411 RepID=UPI00271A552D|nr:phage Gp37/Gp68 family protein [Cypionkella sp.]MDO8982995.1 phage Gp37/Gp68 family protein [Cypionkella sp.]
MAENSNIEWTKHTFNPHIGCTKVGPGCDHCYAEVWDARGLQQAETRWGPHAQRTRTSAANWRKPIAWNKAAAALGEFHRVFCASLADVFDNHTSIQPQWRRDLGALIEATPNLIWMLLTKRIGNARQYLAMMFPNGVPKNVWLGATVVNQEEADRDIPKLIATPASIRFLSMEPLLGPVDLRGVTVAHGINAMWPVDLVIVGGESGKGARPCDPQWVRPIRDQCVAAGVAFHFKQWGNWHSDALRFTDMQGRCPPPDMNIGKKAAGRTLDGRTWDEMPVVAA